MVLGAILFISPFIWMLSASLKTETEVFSYPIQWIPSEFMWENYKTVWEGDFLLSYWNSIKVTVITTVVSLIVSALAGYGFAVIKFKGRDILFLVVLLTLMIPSQAIIVPQFMIYQYLDLYDTHLGLVLLNAFGVMGTFLLRQFFLGVPREVIESAKMDGAGQFLIFRKIALPLVMPGIATLAILGFISTWNDYQSPLIFLMSDHLNTIQVTIAEFASDSGALYSLQMAGTVSAIFPLLIIFIFCQKFVLEGIARGAVKG